MTHYLLFLYIFVGLLLAEGSYWAARKDEKPYSIGIHLITVTIWPFVLLGALYQEYGSKS